MKYPLAIILLLTLITSSYAQREFSIEDTDADGDATIEIIAPQAGELELRSMLLGVNQSNGGFLRMLSDDPLSLRTNNINRLTLTPSGDVGIGSTGPKTKLFVKNGRIATETMDVVSKPGLSVSQASGYDFYTRSTYQGGMSYVNGGADGKLLFINNQGGSIALKTGTQAGLLIQQSGEVQINDLAGTGSRPVYADEDGNLNIDESSQYLVVGSAQFVKRGDGSFYHEDDYAEPSTALFNTGFSYAHPLIPANKYLVEEVVITFYDNDADYDAYYTLKKRGPDVNRTVGSLHYGGQSNSVRTFIIPVGEVFDQVAGEYMAIQFYSNSDDEVRFYRALVKYKIIY